jgi:hypothetical protein
VAIPVSSPQPVAKLVVGWQFAAADNKCQAPSTKHQAPSTKAKAKARRKSKEASSSEMGGMGVYIL